MGFFPLVCYEQVLRKVKNEVYGRIILLRSFG